MTDVTRVAVVGAGAVAQLAHIPLCIDRRDVEVVALADADEARARTLADRFGIDRVMSTDDLLGHPDVDAVILCTPNHLHEDQAIAALERGKSVLVERPLALSPEGCERVLAAARSAGRTLAVGTSHRFRPEVAALRAFVSGGALGDVYSARAAWMNRSLNPRRATWRQRPAEAGGGALMDLGVQTLDMLLWILGPTRVRRVTAVLAGAEGEVESAATVLMETESGAALTLEVSWNYFGSQDKHYARVMGSAGSGQLPPLEIYKRVGGRPLDVTPEQGAPLRSGNPFLNAHRRQIDQFFRTVRGFGPDDPPEEQAEVMRILAAAYRSAREGRWVEL